MIKLVGNIPKFFVILGIPNIPTPTILFITVILDRSKFDLECPARTDEWIEPELKLFSMASSPLIEYNLNIVPQILNRYLQTRGFELMDEIL